MNKRGQFYIIASIFVVMILFGMSAVSTYTVIRPETRTLPDLAVDLEREGYTLIEYGIFNKENLTQLSDSFTGEDIAEYFLKKTNNANIIFVYGNKSDLHSLSYITVNTWNVTAGGGGWQIHNSYSQRKKITEDDKDDDFIKVDLLDKKHFFDLRENEMFYFIIAKKTDIEIEIERNNKQ